MADQIDSNRRRFLAAAAMTLATAKSAASSTPREWAALARGVDWINSPRLTADALQGKVVLVEFWTYTCINWRRTLPYVRAWAQKYEDRLLVIGVHTPEFPFEHDIENVRRAVRQMAIEYPVVLDNDYGIWNGFDNHYWPAMYFLDGNGRVRRHHFGEGEYEQSEQMIQDLLSVHEPLAAIVGTAAEAAPDWSDLRSAETYLRSDTDGFGHPWSLSGKWTVDRQGAASEAANAGIALRFHARDLHLVMGPSRRGSTVRFRVTIDGKVPGAAHGVDVDEDGNGVVVDPRMYQLIRQPKPIVDRQFQIEFLDPGAETFSFTFG